MFDHVPLRSDILVFVVGVFLYLTDLGRLLYANEVLLVGRTSSKWFSISPDAGFFFNRRYAVFPRPYDPGTVVIRFLWPTSVKDNSSPRPVVTKKIDSRLATLTVPKVFCTMLLPEIFLGIPIAYSLPNNIWPTFAMILVIYAQIFTLVVWLLLSRSKLDLPWKSSLTLAFESLVCPPYAINFYRKLAEKTVHQSVTGILETGACLLPPENLDQLHEHLRNAIDHRLKHEQDTASVSAKLAAFRSRLNQE